MTRLSALLGGIVVLGSLAACGGSDLVLPTETGPGDIRPFSGDNQQGLAGAELGEPLVVRVLDRRGQPLSNQRVAFGLAAEIPGAEIIPATAETGDDGTAQARWVLGRVSGSQTAVARVVGVDGLEVRFNAIVRAAGASHIEAAGGTDQTAPVGTELANPLVVRVIDGFGNPVEGITVVWDAEDGRVSPDESVTGDDGRASTSWTLGSASGSQSASASSKGLNGSPVDFAATARAGGADRLVRVSGDDQSGRPGSRLADPLVVRLVDNAGNGVPNRAVSWVVANGGGDADPGTSTTDAGGRARTEWTLGPGEGQNTLNAVVSGVGVVGFSATATNGGGGGGGGSTASRLAFQLQPSDTEKDKKITPPVEVVVLDEDGDRVTEGEFEIKLELTGDEDGELKGKRSERTQFGVATFNNLKVDEEGEYRLRASADGLPSVESDRFEVQDD